MILKSKMFLAVACAALLLAVNASAQERPSPNAERLNTAFGRQISLADQGNDLLIRDHNNSTAELYADGILTSLSTQRIFRDTLPSVADYTQTAHRQASENYCGPIAGSICQPGSRWVMWDTPFMQMDRQKSRDGYLGYDYNSSGFATGITRLIGDYSAVGLAVGYDYRHQEGRDGYFQKLKGDAFHAALYGGTNMGAFFFDGYAGFSWTSQRSRRLYMGAAGADDYNEYRGNYNDNIFSAGLKASYVWALPGEARITPSVGLDFSRVHTNSFTEKGVGMNRLRVDSKTYNTAQLPVMIAANKTFSCGFLAFGGVNSLWTPEVRGGWVPEFGQKQPEVNAFHYDIANRETRFSSKAIDRGNSYGVVGAGLKIQLKDKFIFAVDYDYRFGKKYSSHILTGTYGVSF